MFDAALALEKARLERVHGCPIWKTAKGELIPVVSMETSHLYSAWRYMIRAALNTKSDRVYQVAIERLAVLKAEFNIRKLSYETKDLEALIEKNQQAVNHEKIDDTYDRDMDDSGNDAKGGWWYLGDDD